VLINGVPRIKWLNRKVAIYNLSTIAGDNAEWKKSPKESKKDITSETMKSTT
jgi:hypothetical protein